MHRTHRAALVALQLFAALACVVAASAVATGATRARDSAAYGRAASYLSASEPSSAQRRRRRRRRRRRSRERSLRLDSLTPGMWGGDHVRLEVTEGGATVDFDCAHGRVEGRIAVDSAGRFDVGGMFYAERGGPVREGEEARPVPMRLTGLVGGSIMKLRVTRGGTQMGDYTLTRDREPRVVKCR